MTGKNYRKKTFYIRISMDWQKSASSFPPEFSLTAKNFVLSFHYFCFRIFQILFCRKLEGTYFAGPFMYTRQHL